MSHFRWRARYTVLFLLFTAWVVSYIDRMVMAASIPYIAKDFHLSPVQMGMMMSAFFLGYSLLQVPGGILADKLGSLKVMTGALIWWSIFTGITGLVSGVRSMLCMRVLFGAGEGIFPGATKKTIAHWFPVKDRSTANAIMLSSNALGPALAPLFVAAVISTWGWRAVFMSLFVPGLVVVYFLRKYCKDNPEDSKHITADELVEIRSVEPKLRSGAEVTWLSSLKSWRIWQCFWMWFTLDITLWGFASWLPTYLIRVRGFALVKMGIAASLPFFAGAIGLIAGGWISDRYFPHSRKIPIIITQVIGAFFLYLTYTVVSPQEAIVYQTLAGGFLYMAMGAFWALPMSIIPKTVMGTASALVTMGGQLAGLVSPMTIGYLVQMSGGSFNTSFMFLIAGTVLSSLIALTVKEAKPAALGAAAS
jgi:sugar phosphate permease